MMNRITRFGAFLLLAVASLRACGQTVPTPSTALLQDLRGTDYDRLCWAALYIEMCAGPKLLAISEGGYVPRFKGNQLVSKVLPKSESDAVRAKYRKWLENLRESNLAEYEKLESIYLKEEQANLRSPYCTLLGALTSNEPEAVLAALHFVSRSVGPPAFGMGSTSENRKTTSTGEEMSTRESVMVDREYPIKYITALSHTQRAALDIKFREWVRHWSDFFRPTSPVIFRAGKGPHNSQ